MAKIVKLPSGSYRAQPMIGGVRISITDPDRNKVKMLVAQFEAGQKNIMTGNISVKEAIEEYVQDKKATLSPATIRGYDQIARNYFDNDFGYTKIGKITTASVQKFVNRLSAEHSPKTVRNIYALMRSSFAYNGVEVDRRISLPKRKENPKNAPTDAQVKELLTEADPDLRIAILLSAFGTLRRSEIAALTMKDFDFKKNTVKIDKALVQDEHNQFQVKDPKTKSSNRTVILPEFVIGEIKAKGSVCDISPSQITNRFLRLRNRLDLTVRFHDLRHYSASIMHALQIPDQYIMGRGGWKSDRVMKSVYRNEISDVSKQMNAKVNEYFAHEFAHDIKKMRQPQGK